MKKQFVPYELALMLKEKGFNERCVASWLGKIFSFDGKEVLHIDERYGNGQDQIYLQLPIKCLAPLWQQVVNWFREKHDIHIDNNNNYSLESYWWKNGKGCGFKERVRIKKYSYYINRGEYKTKYYATPYEALEKAIEHALTLI